MFTRVVLPMQYCPGLAQLYKPRQLMDLQVATALHHQIIPVSHQYFIHISSVPHCVSS